MSHWTEPSSVSFQYCIVESFSNFCVSSGEGLDGLFEGFITAHTQGISESHRTQALHLINCNMSVICLSQATVSLLMPRNRRYFSLFHQSLGDKYLTEIEAAGQVLKLVVKALQS